MYTGPIFDSWGLQRMAEARILHFFHPFIGWFQLLLENGQTHSPQHQTNSCSSFRQALFTGKIEVFRVRSILRMRNLLWFCLFSLSFDKKLVLIRSSGFRCMYESKPQIWPCGNLNCPYSSLILSLNLVLSMWVMTEISVWKETQTDCEREESQEENSFLVWTTIFRVSICSPQPSTEKILLPWGSIWTISNWQCTITGTTSLHIPAHITSMYRSSFMHRKTGRWHKEDAHVYQATFCTGCSDL